MKTYNNGEDDEPKPKTIKRYKLRDGSYTEDLYKFRKDKLSAPTRGDYDPKSNKPSEGQSIKKTDVETVVREVEMPIATGVKAKRISKLKK